MMYEVRVPIKGKGKNAVFLETVDADNMFNAMKAAIVLIEGRKLEVDYARAVYVSDFVRAIGEDSEDNLDKAISNFVDKVYELYEEPLDGDETERISKKVLKALDEFNANY